MTSHLNHLVKTVQMRGHNICFYAELTKTIPYYHQIHPLIKSSDTSEKKGISGGESNENLSKWGQLLKNFLLGEKLFCLACEAEARRVLLFKCGQGRRQKLLSSFCVKVIFTEPIEQ